MLLICPFFNLTFSKIYKYVKYIKRPEIIIEDLWSSVEFTYLWPVQWLMRLLCSLVVFASRRLCLSADIFVAVLRPEPEIKSWQLISLSSIKIKFNIILTAPNDIFYLFNESYLIVYFNYGRWHHMFGHLLIISSTFHIWTRIFYALDLYISKSMSNDVVKSTAPPPEVTWTGGATPLRSWGSKLVEEVDLRLLGVSPLRTVLCYGAQPYQYIC
jgi:hypothetical protein